MNDAIRDLSDRYPGMLLLFRHGDEYRFDVMTHAEKAMAVGVPRCFPKSELETNLRKLIRGGKRIALCDAEDYGL